MANQPRQTRENKKVIWNSSLRPKVGDVVEYNGVFYTNLTGLNTEPGVGSDWDRQFLINDIKEIPNRDYNDLLNKPDLSAFNDLVQANTLNDFPATGDATKLYIALDTGYTYRWGGSSYIQLTDQTAIWGQISGTLTDQADLQTAFNGKVDKVSGKGLSDENYTLLEKNKLAGIEASAEVNVQSDWNATIGDAFILNKPAAFTPSPHTHSISEVNNLQNELNTATITIDLTEVLSEEFLATHDLRINTYNFIKGGLSITIKANDLPYTLGEVISQGEKISVSVDTVSVINLNVFYE